MKQLILSLLTFSCLGAFAAANDVVISFSTPGPDKYADGTTVLDGECYALCWSAGDFGGIAANGQPVNANDKIVLTAPVAKGGRCPNIAFEIDASFAAANYPNGNYSVWLLDTRRADGKLFGVKDNAAIGVNAAVATTAAVSTTEGQPATVAATKPASTADGVAAVVPAADAAKKPAIKAFKIVDGKVYITIANTVPYLQYGVEAGAAPDATSATADAAYPEADGEVTIVKPVKPNGEFFKAVTK